MEEWKDIQGFEGYYQVSSLGRIKSLEREIIGKSNSKRIYKEKILKSRKWRKDRYWITSFCVNGTLTNHLVHRIIAKAFIPNPENKSYINHINGIKSDNRIENLEWSTQGENNSHAYKLNLNSRKGSKNCGAKITEEQVLEIKKRLFNHEKIEEIIKDYPVGFYTIQSIKLGRRWTHIKIEENNE